MLTIPLGHICVYNPRLVLRDSKKIANYRPGRRSRWIRQPSPSSAAAKGNKEVKEEGDGKGINGVGEKEPHNRTGYTWKDNARL